MEQPVMRKCSILVAGDVVVDHHLYEGQRDTPALDGRRGVRDFRELGGAALLKETLACVLAHAEIWSVDLGIQTPGLDENPCGHHAYATWKPFPISHADKEKDKDKVTKVWRADLAMGYGHTEETKNAPCAEHMPVPLPNLPSPSLLVLDDGGSTFRQPFHAKSWLLPEKDQSPPPWILLKMSSPVAHGDLWHELISRFSERLVCVVSSDALREQCAGISTGLSWERTAEDVREALLTNPILTPLTRCRHLIIEFSADGALWVDRSAEGKPKATLIFDAAGAEGGLAGLRDGQVFGYSAIMTVALAQALVGHLTVTGDIDHKTPPAFVPAIEAGLSAMRDLLELGHGPVKGDAPKGFPVERVAKVIAGNTTRFASAEVPWRAAGEAPPEARQTWMIVEASQRPAGLTVYPPLVGLGRQIVLQGGQVLKKYPHARFGKLTSLDRREIETLRNLRRRMAGYSKNDPGKKPLSIGVFGPPGAGKSFGVKQIAEEVFGEKAWIEFNLSQFDGPRDLIGAFHQVRDLVLSGLTPVVFWDEFDTKSLDWLKYLLAPMQDGRFQEGQVSHWIGKCVFVFAGGTSPTFRKFAPPRTKADSTNETEEWRQYKLSKGPDFHSRLDVYYNVAGPNPRDLDGEKDAALEPKADPTDVCYPLRRALLIRSLIAGKSEDRLDFDSDLLDALLLVPKYKHGARSLEKIVVPLIPRNGGPIRRAALPAPEELWMHVDEKDFQKVLARNEAYVNSAVIEGRAAAIHEFWRKKSKANNRPTTEQFDKPYAELAPIDQEENRAAARRLPRVLALVGLGLIDAKTPASPSDPSNEDIEKYLKFHIELLAEGEHDGWWEHRKLNGWQLGKERANERRIHNLLVPYADLPENERIKDKDAVLHYPEMAEKAEYRITWLEP